MRNGVCSGITVLVEKSDLGDMPSKLASTGKYVMALDIFRTLRDLSVASGGKIQLVDGIQMHAKQELVETVDLNRRLFDCGPVKGFVVASKHGYQKRKSNFNEQNLSCVTCWWLWHSSLASIT